MKYLFKQLLSITALSLMFLFNPLVGFAYSETDEHYYMNDYNYLNSNYISEDEVFKFDNYVILEEGIFIINEEGYLNLSDSELERLDFILNNTNENNANNLHLNARNNFVKIEDNKMIFTYIEPNSILARNAGVTSITFNWWGLHVKLSAHTLNTIGDGIAIAGLWIPHNTASRSAATLGIIMGRATRGIQFDVRPQASGGVILPMPTNIRFQ